MSPTKIPTYRHEPLETWQLNGILRNLNMSEAELSRLTGAREKTIALWLDERATDRPPPHWLRVFLDLMNDQANRDRAHETTNKVLLDEATYREKRDGP